MSSLDLSSITNKLKLRTCGATRFDVRARNLFSVISDSEAIDQYLSSLGYINVDVEWMVQTREDAAYLLRSILHRDLAYKDICLPATEAHACVSEFLSLFKLDAKFYTNSEWKSDENGVVDIFHFMAITEATLDAGIVAIDSDTIGMIWVEDED